MRSIVASTAFLSPAGLGGCGSQKLRPPISSKVSTLFHPRSRYDNLGFKAGTFSAMHVGSAKHDQTDHVSSQLKMAYGKTKLSSEPFSVGPWQAKKKTGTMAGSSKL